MKKLFLLIPALVLSLAVSAKEIKISSGTTDIISTTIADAGTEDGDVLVLTDNGPYVQANQILFTKSITLRAAEGKLPVVAQQYYSELKNSAQVNIIGIKFDGSLYNSVGAIDHCFRCGDATDNKTLYMENCEITSFKSYIFYIKGGNNLKSCTLKDCKFSSSKRFFYVEGTTTVNQLALDGCEIYSFSERAIGTNSSALIGACNIENCYFHNNASNSLYMENTSESNINITNSTFVDNATPASSGVVHAKATSGTISVNHCTFYNCPVSSSSYGTVQFVSPNAVVSNSIFVLPTTTNVRAIHMPDNNTVNNCLTYKYTYDTDGIRDGISKTNCKTGNPYFMNTNPANYDFTIWTTSPAHGTANDSYDLGDYTRWNTDPATHVATINITAEDANSLKAAVDAALPGDEIVLAEGTYNESASIELDKNLTIKAADGASPVVKPVKEIAISNGANITLQGIKFDGSSQEGISKYIYAADNSANNLTVEGCKFYNTSYPVIYAGSSAHLNACVINNCYFHNGTNSAVSFARTNQEYNACDDLTITNSTFANFSGFNAPVIAFYNKNETTNTPTIEDAKLVIDHCTFYNFVKTDLTSTYGFVDSRKSGNVVISNSIFAHPSSETKPYASYCYGGTVNNCLIYNTNGHRTDNMTINNSISADPLFTDAANGDFTFPGDYANDNISPARNAGTDGSDLGDPRWYTPVTYPSTDFAAPGYTFLAKHAELAGNIEYNTTTATPYIRYTDNSDPGTATWTVTATRACQVKVAMNMVDNSAYLNGNGKHRFVVELLEGNVVKSYVEETSEVDEDGRTFPRSYDMPGYITIPAAGDYTIRVRNPRANSRCGLASITLTYSYEGGNVVNIPVAAIPFEDALLHDGATRDGDGLHFMNAQYVEWNIHAAEGLYTFSATCTSSNYSNLTIKVKQGASELYSYTPQYSYNTTDNVISSPQWILDEGDYTLELSNPTSGNGYVSALSATAATDIFILNENTEEDGSIAAKDEAHWRLMLRRTFTAGKYYSICIPIDSYDDELTSVFGTGYELWKMESATQNGEEVSLNFTQITNGDFFAGTPYLIKPAQDVANPTFSSHTIHNSTYNNVKSFDAADFVGSFYKTEIPAGENNLYLQNNNLYYSETNDTPIKGTRAWIRLKPQGPNYVKARIVLGPKVVTSINLVNGELLEGTVKTIENGQLVIIRDGVKYNAMGIKLQ